MEVFDSEREDIKIVKQRKMENGRCQGDRYPKAGLIEKLQRSDIQVLETF